VSGATKAPAPPACAEPAENPAETSLELSISTAKSFAFAPVTLGAPSVRSVPPPFRTRTSVPAFGPAPTVCEPRPSTSS